MYLYNTVFIVKDEVYGYVLTYPEYMKCKKHIYWTVIIIILFVFARRET